MGATNDVDTVTDPPFCFNPRTRDGCDVCCHAAAKSRAVSIHAPVMGATKSPQGSAKQSDLVSIHAPVMGATCNGNEITELPEVSIHAPVMGATTLQLSQ